MGNTLANVPLVEHGDESGLLAGGSSKAGDKPIMGSIMGKVVEALNQAQQRQRSVEVSSKAQAAYVGEGRIFLRVRPCLLSKRHTVGTETNTPISAETLSHTSCK